VSLDTKDIYRKNVYDLQKQLQESYINLKNAHDKIYQLKAILETLLKGIPDGSQFPTRSTDDK
jgi:hypothetical protein